MFTSDNGVLLLFFFLKTMFILGSDFQSSFYTFECYKNVPPNCTKTKVYKIFAKTLQVSSFKNDVYFLH